MQCVGADIDQKKKTAKIFGVLEYTLAEIARTAECWYPEVGASSKHTNSSPCRLDKFCGVSTVNSCLLKVRDIPYLMQPLMKLSSRPQYVCDKNITIFLTRCIAAFLLAVWQRR